MRNHPGLNYFRSGIPIVLSGDDPGSFGYNDLTVDYYLAYMAWGLDLYDLKVIANNSLKYSLIPDAKKTEGYGKFQVEWNNFIDEIFESVCEATSQFQNENLNVSDLLPPYGPSDAQTDITIYGYGFDFALCREIYCLFNNVLVDAVMTNLDQIRCLTPLGFDQDSFANVSLQIDDVVYDTGFKYKFVSPSSISVVDDHKEDKQTYSFPEIFSCNNPILNDFFTYKCHAAMNANFNVYPILLLTFFLFVIYYVHKSKRLSTPSSPKQVLISYYNYKDLKQSSLNI